MTKHFTEAENAQWLANLPKKSVGVKVVLTSPDGKILLVKPNYKKTWQMPGGGVEPSESPEEAVVREVAEETGLVIKQEDIRIAGTAFRKEHDNLILIYEYLLPVDPAAAFNLPPDEIEGITFMEPRKVPELLGDYYLPFWQRYLS
jgi:ADP-ribose pyrophosphatase YjhB (NUDIX family)